VRQVGGAAIVPLSISGIPYFGRVSEAALREVDRGLVEAVRAMGGGHWAIIREALVPEAPPSLIAGFTVTLVLLVGASAMAGAVGAGGLGDLAIRYGYQRFETSVMVAVIVVLIAGRAHSGWRRPFGEAGRSPVSALAGRFWSNSARHEILWSGCRNRCAGHSVDASSGGEHAAEPSQLYSSHRNPRWSGGCERSQRALRRRR
jgi:hypothetical protein